MSLRTQEAYLAAVADVAQHYPQRPEVLSVPQVEAYLRHLIEQRPLAPNRVRIAVFGLRFFSTVTLHRQPFTLPLPTGVKKLPEVLSRAEVTRLLASPTTLRERALVMTTYGGGLRVSEAGRLGVSVIDGQRDRLRLEHGKGRKDRYPLLGPGRLAEVRHDWRSSPPIPVNRVRQQTRHFGELVRALIVRLYSPPVRRA